MNFLDRKKNDPTIWEKSFSQFEEEEVIGKFFAERWSAYPGRVGRFMDIGASNGYDGNNCVKLAFLGWRGVCVEANPFLFTRLHEFYAGHKKVETVCGCVDSIGGIAKLHLNNNGLATADESVFRSLKAKEDYFGHAFVPRITPDELAAEFGRDFDFVSIDAEGFDQRIARNCGNLLMNASMLCVETDRPKQSREIWYQAEWEYVMEQIGFTKVYHQTRSNTILIRP